MEDLEKLASARARAQDERNVQSRKITTWRWFVCAWPLLPIIGTFAGGVYGALFGMTALLVYPIYLAWTLAGTFLATMQFRRGAALGKEALALNVVCLIASILLLLATYTGQIRIHM